MPVTSLIATPPKPPFEDLMKDYGSAGLGVDFMDRHGFGQFYKKNGVSFHQYATDGSGRIFFTTPERLKTLEEAYYSQQPQRPTFSKR